MNRVKIGLKMSNQEISKGDNNMNLEYLQSLSDTELNELAAVKVMGWERKSDDNRHFLDKDGFRVYVWNPIGDMNDTMQLKSALGELHFLEYIVNIIDMTGHVGDINIKCIGDILKLTPRQHTIAIIMAKFDEQIASILAKEE